MGQKEKQNIREVRNQELILKQIEVNQMNYFGYVSRMKNNRRESIKKDRKNEKYTQNDVDTTHGKAMQGAENMDENLRPSWTWKISKEKNKILFANLQYSFLNFRWISSSNCIP